VLGTASTVRHQHGEHLRSGGGEGIRKETRGGEVDAGSETGGSEAASRRRTKVVLIVLGSILGATFFLCVVMPAFIWLFSAIARIPLIAWVIIFASLLAIGVIAAGVGYCIWYYRNAQLRE
jgi:hypothetical protein